MRDIMMVYDGDQIRYAKLSGHGFRMLAEAMEKDLPYMIPCPAILICGEKDRVGSTRRYNRAWHDKTGIPLEWIKDAAGTKMMSLISDQNRVNDPLMSLHGVTGILAIILMLVHAVWATVVLIRNNEEGVWKKGEVENTKAMAEAYQIGLNV